MKNEVPTSIRLDKRVVDEIDAIAQSSHRSRAWIIKEAVSLYLDERADLDVALSKLQDPASEYIEWEIAKNALLH
jgi:predicted transcriptional regulator